MVNLGVQGGGTEGQNAQGIEWGSEAVQYMTTLRNQIANRLLSPDLYSLHPVTTFIPSPVKKQQIVEDTTGNTLPLEFAAGKLRRCILPFRVLRQRERETFERNE
ncbi:hypothetical protein LXL04_016424 [Taraxacum kok-saghyz]